MRNIYADIRYFLAYTDLAKLHIGSIVHDHIKKFIIPKLTKGLLLVKDPRDKEKVTALIEEYKRYSDPRTSEPKFTIKRQQQLYTK